MRKIVLGLAVSLVSLLNVFSQNSSDNDKVYNSFKDKRIDSILNAVTPSYYDHSKLKKEIVNLLYAKKYNDILAAIKCKGFAGFVYLGNNITETFKSNTTPDSVYINTLKIFAKNLPKNKTTIKRTFKDMDFLKDKMFFEEYGYVVNNTTYFLRIVYINSQMNGILLDVRKY